MSLLKWEPARYLSSLSKIPETELFVSEASVEKLKTIGVILAAVIPIIISVIELLQKWGSNDAKSN